MIKYPVRHLKLKGELRNCPDHANLSILVNGHVKVYINKMGPIVIAGYDLRNSLVKLFAFLNRFVRLIVDGKLLDCKVKYLNFAVYIHYTLLVNCINPVVIVSSINPQFT